MAQVLLPVLGYLERADAVGVEDRARQADLPGNQGAEDRLVDRRDRLTPIEVELDAGDGTHKAVHVDAADIERAPSFFDAGRLEIVGPELLALGFHVFPAVQAELDMVDALGGRAGSDDIEVPSHALKGSRIDDRDDGEVGLGVDEDVHRSRPRHVSRLVFGLDDEIVFAGRVAAEVEIVFPVVETVDGSEGGGLGAERDGGEKKEHQEDTGVGNMLH